MVLAKKAKRCGEGEGGRKEVQDPEPRRSRGGRGGIVLTLDGLRGNLGFGFDSLLQFQDCHGTSEIITEEGRVPCPNKLMVCVCKYNKHLE